MTKTGKIVRTICGIAAAAGFFLLLGTAGASDLGKAGIPAILARGGAGVALFAAGLKGAKAACAI